MYLVWIVLFSNKPFSAKLTAGSSGKSDIRHLATSAKTLHELEGVVAIPELLEVRTFAAVINSDMNQAESWKQNIIFS